MQKHTLITLLALIFATSLSAQRMTTFLNTKDGFLTQLENFMTTSKTEAMQQSYKDFEESFNAGLFTDSEFQQILKTGNDMLGQKMTASPYFKDYIKALVIVKNHELGETRFKDWHKVLDQMLANIENRKLKPYKEFLKFSIPFYDTQTLRFSKGGTNWIADASRYEAVFEEEKPAIKFNEVNIIAARKNDTIKINNTQGKFFPLDKKWIGKGGKVDWDRFSTMDERTYAEFGEYNIDMSKTLYSVSNVKFYFEELFPGKAITGNFQDKIMTTSNDDDGSYPRFESKDTALVITNLGEGLKYTGGFKMNGNTIYGQGTDYKKANIKFEGIGGVKYNCTADLFVMKKEEKIVGERVETVLYFAQDSIYHPSANIKYDIPNQLLSLNRGKRGSDRNPFFSSYHKVNVDVDKLDWVVNTDSILFGRKTLSLGNDRNELTLESFDYYEEGDYRRLQNISTTNPLATLKRVADEEGMTKIDANVIAKKMNPKFDHTSIQSLLYDLVAQGFVNYDSENQVVELRKKVFHYADASQKKVDYDRLKILSKSKETNAIINLTNKGIISNGIKKIEFSPVQKVAIIPNGEQIVMLKNRDMDFDGKLYAGLSVMEGKDYHFNYDEFKITMDSIRYFDLFVPDGTEDEKGNPNAFSIASRLEHVSGVLLIDAPSNKSGVEDLGTFPSFNTSGPSYVYYDQQENHNGAYKRDSFYYQLDKFNFNSIDDFTKEDVDFKGNLISADIFPKFKENLVLREEDQSLGFVHTTPAKGRALYTGKGNYTGEVDLSNAGLFGKGNVEYLYSNFDSEDILFRPKKLTASAEKFELDEIRTAALEVPQVAGLDVNINWKPYTDSMYVNTKELPFDFFKQNDHKLDGTMVVTPGGVFGDGKFEWSKGIFTSELFDFGAYLVLSDTANLKIKAVGDDFAFDTRNVNGKLDFDKKLGKFKGNSDAIATSLPVNKYETSMNEFDWDMANETIKFKALDGLSTFLSVHEDQDSITFQGATAFYDLKTNLLSVGGVPHIVTADAFVYAENGDVEIQPGGTMTTLENAKIVCDTTNKHHVINRATVNVLGRKLYKAKGFYEYNVGTHKQEIEFTDIIGTRVGKGARDEKATETRAAGTVKEEDNFFIDDKLEFRGDISLAANSKELQFDGFAKLDAPNLPTTEWFSTNFEGDKNNLILNFNEPKTYKGYPVRCGLFINGERGNVYPSIMASLPAVKDRPILDARGMMKYDEDNNNFIFGDSLKVISDYKQGKLLKYNVVNNDVLFEGPLNIGSGLKHVDLKTAGYGRTSVKMKGDTSSVANNVLEVDAMASVDFYFPEKVMKIMINDLKQSTFDASTPNYQKNIVQFGRTLSEFIPDSKKLFGTMAEVQAKNYLDFPKKDNTFKFLLSELNLKWDADYRSFVTRKSKNGLYSVNGEYIDKLVEMYLEVRMPPNEDDRFYIYIKSPSDYFYFFGYKEGIMNVSSNNQKFVDALMGLKSKELIRTIKKKGDEEDDVYEIAPVDVATANRFLMRAKAVQGK